jgi:hypothetical protein
VPAVSLATEADVSDCVELYHIIVTCVPLNSNLVQCLNQNGVTEALLDLTTFILLSAPLSTLRQSLVGICQEIMMYGDATQTVPILDQIITFGWKHSYQLTDSGGIEIRKESQQRQSQNISSLIGSKNIITPFSSSSEMEEEDYMMILRDALIQQQSLLIDPDTETAESSSSLHGVQTVMERTRAICNLLNEVSSSDDDADPSAQTEGGSNAEKTSPPQTLIPSKLFLRMLRGYLEISSGGDTSASANIEEVFLSSTPSHVCGIVVLVMKSHLSLDILLQDGLCHAIAHP